MTSHRPAARLMKGLQSLPDHGPSAALAGAQARLEAAAPPVAEARAAGQPQGPRPARPRRPGHHFNRP